MTEWTVERSINADWRWHMCRELPVIVRHGDGIPWRFNVPVETARGDASLRRFVSEMKQTVLMLERRSR